MWFLNWGIWVIEGIILILSIIIFQLPRWKTPLQGVLVLVLCLVIFATPAFIYIGVVKRQPIQTVHVEVVSKRIERHNNPSSASRTERWITFKFPDDSEYELLISNAGIFNNIHEGDTGMLSFKETKDDNRSIKYFETFEKDRE